MPSRTRSAVVAAVTAAALLGAPAAATAAAPDAWSAAPAPGGAGAGSSGRPYFYLEGAPGTVLTDKIAITNPGAAPRTVRLRGTDADGAGSAGRTGGAGHDAGAWLSLASKTVKVPPRTRADVPFTVTVPADAVPGDHPGAIVVSGDGRQAGVRLALRVSGPTLAALSVEDVRVTGRGAAARIRYALVNHGNVTLTPRLAVSADGVFGQVLRRPARTLPVELRPGQRVRLSEKWADAPSFDSVRVELTATAGGGAHATASADYRALPWGWAAVLATGLCLGGAAWFARRRRRRAPPPAGGPAGEETGEREELAGTGSGART
ncbi:hypothetical protein AB0I22_31760 [Streptomyces sp. NPDC050610]|uniref:COG1470 family protein n=1 Tax=Streptomyces sp. NPDC050610 TaxID=3157097 RepID=UPI00343943AB